jgi:hypothetical protein
MLERDVMAVLRAALSARYELRFVTERAQGGFADVLVQADTGVVAALEGKCADLVHGDRFTLDFRPQQIPWLWRWARRGPAAVFFGVQRQRKPHAYGFIVMPRSLALAQYLKHQMPLSAAHWVVEHADGSAAVSESLRTFMAGMMLADGKGDHWRMLQRASEQRLAGVLGRPDLLEVRDAE